jgi:hypothetical protein
LATALLSGIVLSACLAIRNTTTTPKTEISVLSIAFCFAYARFRDACDGCFHILRMYYVRRARDLYA